MTTTGSVSVVPRFPQHPRCATCLFFLSVRPLLLIFLVGLLAACTTIRAVQTVYGGKSYGPPESQIPFTLNEHPILIKTLLNESPQRYTLVLDTGSITVIRAEVARALGLPDGVEVKAHGSGGGSKRIRLAKLNRIVVGDMEVKNTAAGIIEFPELFPSGVAGILGSTFLRHFRVTIDYQKREIRLSKSRAAVADDGRDSAISFDIDPRSGFAPIIGCKIDGNIEAQAMIDTGAVGISLPDSILRKTRAYQAGKVLRANGSMSGGMFGAASRSEAVLLNELTIGDIPYTDIPVTSHAGLKYVLLGNRFLRNFVVTLDYPAKRLTLKPVRTGFSHQLLSYGLALSKEDGKTVVSGIWEGSSAAESDLGPRDEVLKINSEDVADKSLLELMVRLVDPKQNTLKIEFIGDNGIQKTIVHKRELFPARVK
uniref:Aspartyl protease n=1 Tax=Candidatus Kentrum sp. TUN TaxID=2126343 RepID=A0A451A3P4_9GAMM|nr:MAG: Aspartyl protease [Candidatus Kentron sp. TUN]